MSVRRAAGFSLIELLIAASILTLLVLLAGPSVAEFVANSRIRSTAEGLMAGLQQARAEALKRNAQIQFVYGGPAGWSVVNPADDTTLLQDPVTERSAITVTVTPPGAVRVTFSGLGLYVTPNPDGDPPIRQLDVSSSAIASPHNLRIIIDPAISADADKNSGMRVCDPMFLSSSTHPQGCPAP